MKGWDLPEKGFLEKKMGFAKKLQAFQTKKA
jgi:hypothetical protein